MNKADPLFADLAPTAASHFRIHMFGAVLVCIEHATACAEDFDGMLERFPFLIGYNNDLAERLAGMSSAEAFDRWCRALLDWEARTPGHLPLRALRIALEIDPAAMMCLVTVGLVEEDARFGLLFEALQGTPGQTLPTTRLLRPCWQTKLGPPRLASLLQRARRIGLLQLVSPEAPQQETTLRIPADVWEAMRGEESGPGPKWAHCVEKQSLAPLADLILPPAHRAELGALPRLLENGEARVVVLRGPRHNGRRTALGAVARALGRGLIELRGIEKPEDPRWHHGALLALLRHALPVVAFDLGPGEKAVLPDDWLEGLPLGVALGRQGGLAGELAGSAITLTLDLPDLHTRREHWRRWLAEAAPETISEISARFRITAGRIHSASRLARLRGMLAGRSKPAAEDIGGALRTLDSQELDALARRIPTTGDWSRLSASAQTFDALQHLESRCRHREQLPALLDAAPSLGVRALFTGPSGTGKTYAARLLAANLQKDLYQLDLSSTVNKYIGETEKNLNRIFDAAEELDVILLLDEGDALLGQRTDVQSANDRYANLETNFLLQRIESFEGILVVTTNARTRIDSAFERRMDVTVEFHAPDAEARWALWQLHLPPANAVGEAFLSEVASRCELTGGQIRNATLHASLLALDNGGVVKTSGLAAAVRREYVKQGALCPLRHLPETQ